MTIKFCGMTVTDLRTTLGWNEQQSQMGVSLVLDSNDFNLIPPEGYPVYFTYGALEFNGILQRSEEDISTGGRRFNVQVVDAREILRCCSLIVGNYSGSTFTLPNLVNCYAYFENRLGFGSANVTSAGMPWYLIREAINQVVNIPSDTSFGGPLNYKGVRYSVDLSEVPTMPAFYRIQASSISLFDAISQVCKDSNNDFFVTLHGYRIKINTVPKGRTVPAGALRDFIAEATLTSQIAVGGSFGREDVPETSSVMLVGAEKEDLHFTSNIVSFWGYDWKNNPIFGRPGYKLWIPSLGKNAAAGYDFYNGKIDFPTAPKPRVFLLNYDPNNPGSNPPVFSVSESTNYTYTAVELGIEEADLNATPVFDIVRAYKYTCSTLEMRYALKDSGQWIDFIEKMRPDIYALINGFLPVEQRRPNPLPNNADMVKDDLQRVRAIVAGAQGDVNEEKEKRLYSFVRAYAEDFYGKKFACPLPAIASTVDLETLQVVNAADIVQSAYRPEGTAPLGISELNETIFLDNNNKFSAFCRGVFPGLVLDGTSSQNTAVQGNDIYQKVTVEEQILRTRTTLAAVFTLSSPLQETPEGIFGRMQVVAAIRELNMKAFTNGFPMFADFDNIYPPRRTPTAVAIPLRSNVEKYGPYWVKGSPGRTEFIDDSSLAPWNFGGYDAMSVYAGAQLDMAKGTNQYLESGQFQLAGGPLMNMGAMLKGTGPSLTDISCNLNASGITTTYTFRAFSPRNGAMSRQFADRFRSVSLTTQRLRKELKDSIKESLALKQIKTDAVKTIKFEERIKKELRRNTPSDVIVCNVYNKDMEEDGIAAQLHYSQITNLKEALTMLSVDNPVRNRFSTVMSLNGIFAPFQMNPSNRSDGLTKTVKISKFSSNILTWETYNHFANRSIDVLGYGSTYKGVKPKSDTTVAELKPVALRGPIWINGYGPNLKNLQGHTTDKTEMKSKTWMVGPMDPIFDNYRGVWTSHTLIIGKVNTEITAASNFSTTPAISNMGSGSVNILADAPATSNIVKNAAAGLPDNVVLACRNPFSKAISEGTVVMVQYNPHYNCFVVIGADCV